MNDPGERPDFFIFNQNLAMRYFLGFFLVLLFSRTAAQTTPNQELNLSFEKKDSSGKVAGIIFWKNDDFSTHKDDLVKRDGNHSIRIEKDEKTSPGGYCRFTLTLPANFKGKELTLKGYLKTRNLKDGTAGIWISCRGSGNEPMGYISSDDSAIKATQDWQQLSITIPMIDEVTSVSFGGIVSGTGKAWFDNFELLLDNRPIQSVPWLPYAGFIPRPELKTSGIRIDSVLSKQQQDNLFVLGRVWGFLKYHHPEVAKGTFNYDSCLFSIMRPVMNSPTKTERDKILLDWINTLGNENNYPVAGITGNKDVHTKPNLAWINNRTLYSEVLSKKLANIYQHRNKGTNYYVRMVSGIGNPVFSKEAAYKTIPASDDGIRMLALFRYWNIIEYFFPYKHLLKETWTQVLREFIPQFAAGRSDLRYRLACLRLINRIHDTHASIYNDAMLRNHFGNYVPALDFKMIDGKVIVTDYLSDSLAGSQTLMRGDEILMVKGKKIAELRKTAEPYLCASNESVANRNFLDRFLFRSNDSSLNITYKRKDKTQTTKLQLYPQVNVPVQNGDTWRMPMYKFLSPDIGYINLGKIVADSLPAIFKHFENTKGIVIDIRNYPKEFMPFALGEYIKPSASAFVKFTAGDINNPGLFIFETTIENGAGKDSKVKNYEGAIVVLINEQSQSQSEYTAMALRTAPRAIVIGSQTAGADGNISFVPFPGGFSSPFSGIGVFYPGGKDTQGIGIVPNIIVLPTQQGVTAGRDEVLEKAIEYIKNLMPL